MLVVRSSDMLVEEVNSSVGVVRNQQVTSALRSRQRSKAR